MKVHLAQLNPIVGDISYNKNLILNAAKKAHQNKADILVTPELSLTGYPPEDLLLDDEFIKSCSLALIDIAKEYPKLSIVVGYPKFEKGKLYNAASVVYQKKIRVTYFKNFLPNYGVFDEKRYFSKGKENFFFNFQGNKICIMICEDLWNYSSLSNKDLDDIDFLISINASPYENNKDLERINFFREIASVNKFNIVYLNTVGGQDEIVFDGSSFLIDREGNIKHKCNAFDELIYKFSVEDKNFSVNCEYTNDHKYNQYEYLYEALKIGTYDYIKKSNFDGVLLGLSGGIDSALTLAIASDIFNKENIEAVLLPSVFTSDLSIQLAKEQCEILGIKYSFISIEGMNDAITESLKDRFNGLPNDITEENIQARSRGLILMSISNKTGKILLTTGNKSELAVGYSTLYGDMAGSFAPLKDIYKTDVYNLSRYRNSISSVIPEAVIDRMPTAELAQDQYDIDTLPQYDVLDNILKSFIEEKKSLEEICSMGHELNLVSNIINMVIKNEYKRRQYAPGVKVSSESFGRDRRFPIVSRFKY
jgi:NAD+ synthase (glutamine-hydrolysing)